VALARSFRQRRFPRPLAAVDKLFVSAPRPCRLTRPLEVAMFFRRSTDDKQGTGPAAHTPSGDRTPSRRAPLPSAPAIDQWLQAPRPSPSESSGLGPFAQHGLARTDFEESQASFAYGAPSQLEALPGLEDQIQSQRITAFCAAPQHRSWPKGLFARIKRTASFSRPQS